MRLYSDIPRARALQIAGDLVALAVLILGVVAGVALHRAIAGLEAAGTKVAASGAQFQSTLSDIGSKLGAVPLIGSGIRAPFDSASAAGGGLSSAGTQWTVGVERVAVLAGWLVFVLVLLVVLVGWVRPRLIGAVRRGVVARLVRGTPDFDLLALRALTTRSPRLISAVHPHAAQAWRAGDADVVRKLAAIELAASGIRPR
jgi:hypothetical protein